MKKIRLIVGSNAGDVEKWVNNFLDTLQNDAEPVITHQMACGNNGTHTGDWAYYSVLITYNIPG